MKYSNLLFIVVLLTVAGTLFAAPITLTFKDATTATRALVWAENPSYPSPTPTDGSYSRWAVRVYKSTDNVIDPLGSDGLPTGDDVAVTNTGSTQFLGFGPTGGWTGNTPSLICPDPIATPDPNVAYHTSSNKVYIRIFNSTSIATATKYFQATSLYTILSANATITYIPNYGWSSWVTFASAQTPVPAILVSPSNGATGLAFAGQTLSWMSGTGGPSPTGYKVFFGTNTPPTNIVNGTTQTGNTFVTGTLLPNQGYYWKIVPYNGSGDATGAAIWTFITRAENNPNPATVVFPLIGVEINPISFPSYMPLQWEADTSGPKPTPTGYKIYFGTDGGGTITPTNIVNGITQLHSPLTTVQMYDQSLTPAAGTYYWQIVPYYTDPGTRGVTFGKPISARTTNPSNSRGDATGCPIWHFQSALAAAAPTIQASNVNFTNVLVNQITTNWTRGNGSNCVVFLREGTSGTPGNPADGATYTASTDWTAKGTPLRTTGYYCVYNGASTSVTLTNLLSGTNYYAIVYEYNGTGVGTLYKTDGATGNTTTSTPTPAIIITGTLANFGLVKVSSHSAEQSYTVAASNLTANLVITPPIDYQISITSGLNYDTFLSLTPVGGQISSTTIYVRYVPTSLGVNSGSITHTSTGATPQNVAVSGTGINTPVITTPTSASITNNSAILGGNITNFNFSSVSERGIYYSPVSDTTVWTKVSETGTFGTGVFTILASGFASSTSYFFKAFANNAAGTSYTSKDSFTTYASFDTVSISSTPTDADIYVDGVDSGWNTPHRFTMIFGTSAIYSVQKEGYTWLPESFPVTNIQANTSQEFTGTILTYTVDITSTPPGASISTGSIVYRPPALTTPHQFVLEYGTSANYSVSMDGYTWVPENFSVSNIQANTGQEFIGTIITYNVNITSTPPDADIFIDGVDTGVNTPHQFVMNYGTNATYTVQKTGYTWAPESFSVENILDDTSQEFTGTQIAYVASITSDPSGAEIFFTNNVHGFDFVDTGFTTPHQFALPPNSTAFFYVTKPGYTWAPAQYSDYNILSDYARDFVGTLLTYTVDITSTPTNADNADIYLNGVDTGYNTPHQFVLGYGSNATYTVQKAGYTWSPANFVVTNIQANASQAFTGTLLTYTVDITSTPSGANIIANGVRFSTLTTPQQFVLNYGASMNYSVEMPGYTFEPANFSVSNIQANTAQHFVGTILTYTVDITSSPSDADILDGGVDTGFNSPHQFTLNYGSNKTYTVQKAGYTWSPANFVVTNIQANTSQAFTGTLLTYTVDITSTPSGATIIWNGATTGWTTPHQFVLNWHSNIQINLTKTGYTYSPDQLTINNIEANASQEFTGTLNTYAVGITSDPAGAEIFSSLGYTGFVTPHTFTLNYGASEVYHVIKTGYDFTPLNFSVTNIQDNTSQLFTGTLKTYTVDIASTPSNADIYVDGIASGFTTPHQFVLDYGNSAVYTVHIDGYNWSPASLVVNNIIENVSQTFTGTILTYTVDITSDPSGAEIFAGSGGTIEVRADGGISTGFTTPHQFVLEYGTSVTYYVEKPGYTWAPEEFFVNNLQENTGQNFVGTIITYTVDITSTPSGADIFRSGVDTGFNTPYQFVMNYGTSATYTVQQAGYTWSPANFVVSEIQDNASQHFTGTIITYTVNVTSSPSNADIFVDGIDSNHNTPYQFVMNYGTNASYTVQKEGYIWSPASFAVTNIQANTSQAFNGTLLTYTVDITSNPSDADIYINGDNTGYNTPYQFVMEYGTSKTYVVQKAGYTFTPQGFTVTNIQANTAQLFTGTILTYTVDITSTQTNTDIFVNGQDSGYNAPHQFVMNYGTSATYTVQKAGYYWNPTNFVVTNIQANTSQNFIGTLITYTVDITSNPSDADILEGGIDTGFNTPHQFILAQGASGNYRVQKAGYTYTPTNFVVNNIQANTAQSFTGTIITYTVNITSSPSNARIYIYGEVSDYTTPHQFVMDYGTSAIYSVEKEGYTWNPQDLNVNNIHANASQNFVGTLIPYPVNITSLPSEADILFNGQDTGFNTPHQFMMNYGSGGTYTVQKAGYSWSPSNFVVTNIQDELAQMFTGTILSLTVDITSSPTNADIFIGGVDTEYNTPHQFIMTYGTSATYTVQKTGYSWSPASYVITEITTNSSKNFVGSLLTYTVDITSTPAGADILIGELEDSGFNTPHTFVLPFGSNEAYSVQKTGYTFPSDTFFVEDIQANTSHNFVGTINTYTVDITSSPTGADIIVDGADSGFNTPYQFVMNYGSSAIYAVQKPGYTWSPTSFTVNNIQANTGRNFVGSQITYNVNITSTPTNADVYIGNEDTGLNTPCQLVLPQGSNATIRVMNIDYSWAPESFVITNIQANASQHFVGTLLTYHVNVASEPTNADIFVNGQDSGFNTPHQFVMNSSTYAIYSVQKTGYSWVPPSYAVNDIHSNQDLMFTGALLTYTVNINSSPANADIYVNGVDSGYNTPTVFVMNYGSSATYTVQKAGYTWTPASFAVTNIQANASQNFVGTLLTYTVNITSNPTDADIYIGEVDSGFNTPHVFVMNYGDAAVYSVQKIGYIWTPANFVVTNIQANTAQLFIGTTQTYTVDITSDPSNSDIYIGTIDSGFNTPHQFILNHGASATYSVQRPDYIWSPTSFEVVNIQANTSQHFNGSQLALVVTPANQEVTNLAGTTEFLVNSNVAWTVNETEDWLTALPLTSINNGVITVNYDTNPSAVLRIGTITVSGSGITRTITVTQAAALPILTVTPDLQNVPYQTGVTTFTVTSNIAWNVFEDVSWFSVAPSNGSNDGVVTVAYDANGTTSERSGQIILTGSGLSVTVTVVQASMPPTLTVTPEIQNVAYPAGTTTFAIAANVAWTVSETVSWLSVSPLSGNNNGNILVTYNANLATTSRTGSIVIAGGGWSRIVSVTQAGAPGVLTVTPMLQNVSNFAGSTNFTVTSNTSWTVSETVSWLSVSPNSGSLNGHFDVNFQTNPTPATRTGVVTVAWGSSNLTVTIVQSAGVGIDDPIVVLNPSLSVYPNPFAASTNIKVDVTNNNNAELVVYSSKGEQVKTLGIFSKGSYTVTWDGYDKAGRQCSNGFYLIRYKSADLTKTVKVLLIRN